MTSRKTPRGYTGAPGDSGGARNTQCSLLGAPGAPERMQELLWGLPKAPRGSSGILAGSGNCSCFPDGASAAPFLCCVLVAMVQMKPTFVMSIVEKVSLLDSPLPLSQ